MSSQEERHQMKAIPSGFTDPFSETVMGITMPPSSSVIAHSEIEIDVPDHRFYDYDVGPTDILPLPTPQYALSATPSTRYSESPGPFSVSSTPNSMSSYSPGVALSIKSTTRTRQVSPLESRPPPVTRHRTPDEPSVRQQHGLSSVRESTTSSSSGSTILAEGAKLQEKRSAARLPAPSPSPHGNMSFAQRTHTRAQTEPSRNAYRSPPAPEQKARKQAPPELAHLADHSSATLSEPRRPTRPSRDGTSAIYGLRGPSPIIQSNMTAFPAPHKRTPSSESKTGVVPNGKARFGIPTTSSRNPSPNPSLAGGFSLSSRGPTRGPTPELQINTDRSRSRTIPTPTPSPAPAPSPSKTSRFGFFSRRTKTEPVLAAPKSEKLTRRGPVAGTGHEGYGRYALRGRSGSSASGTSIGRSASAGTTTESLEHTPSSRKSSMTSATSEVDDFFLERLEPVVIRGMGSSTELSRSPEPMHSSSSLDLAMSPRQAPKKTTSNLQLSSLGTQRPILLPSAMSDPVPRGSPSKKMTLGSRQPSESDDDAKKSFLPSLATRRTSHASKLMDGAPLSKIPSSGSNIEKQRKGSLMGYASDDKEGKRTKAKKEKAENAAPKAPRKWNFFQRAHAVPKKEVPVVSAPAPDARVPPSRSVAHYAPVDSQSGLGLEDIEQLMQEVDSSPEDTTPAEESAANFSDNEPEIKERMLSMLLPPMPILSTSFALPARPASPKVILRHELHRQPTPQKLTLDTSFQSDPHPDLTAALSPGDLTPVTDFSPCLSPLRSLSPIDVVVSPISAPAPAPAFVAPLQSLSPPGPPPSNPPPRPSRLMQVGRIPQVISRRNQERQRTPQSFSRPFIVDRPRPQAPPRTSFDSVSPLTATAGPIESFPVLQGISALDHASAIATISPSAEEANRRSEFFKFPRKNSEVSYSSSSGAWSFAPVSGTAVVPNSGAPLSEDELWNEYDDLIDEVLSPIDSLTSEVKGKGPKQHPSLEPLPLQTVSFESDKSESSAPGPVNPSLHLRRSRLLAVLHSAQSPTSPLSFSEFLQDYGERNLSVVDPITGRLSFPASARMSTGSGSGSGPRNGPGSTRTSLPASLSLSARQSKATLKSTSDKDRDSVRVSASASANRYRDTRLMEIAETQTDGLVSMANLRFGALMTSKWLSFGRVLFSPVHFELKDSSEDRVLVIDGLGKDWSYYCALTYPEATVYNLGHGAAATTTSNITGPEPWSTLHNHRHISHESLADAFPFPKGFFKCVVLRFPSALSSAVHRTVISECKRVLQPGGHLEFTVLDLDLVNMGNRARRAVRSLKLKMQVADEQVSLRNISDEIMAGLGRKGFIECNRCFVGVPVAGKLPGPEEAESPKKRKGSNASSLDKTGSLSKPAKQPKPEVSFSDLLNAQPSTESTNDGIAEMVARVGRWWYSRCYESLVLPEAGEAGVNPEDLLESSIWRDENLIKECEKRGTSFRLLIGYAQKPEVGFRRTVSV
jgi:hypothetical protein